MREIVLTPNWENTLAYMASAIADGNVEWAPEFCRLLDDNRDKIAVLVDFHV